MKKSDFEERKLMKSRIGGKSIVIGMVDNRLYAMDSICSHEGGPLEEGWLDDHSLTCPWHYGIFDIRSAKASLVTQSRKV